MAVCHINLNYFKMFYIIASTEDIKEAGYNCKNIPFEVWSRGHVTQKKH